MRLCRRFPRKTARRVGFSTYNLSIQGIKNALYLIPIFAVTFFCVSGYGSDDFNDFEIHYKLGNEYNQCGMIDDAITEYKKALDINYASPRVYNNMGVAYSKKKNFDEEIASYKKGHCA